MQWFLLPMHVLRKHRRMFVTIFTCSYFVFFLSAYYAYRASLRAEPDSCTRVDERSYNTNL